MENNKKYALILGGTGSLGKSVAIKFLDKDYNIVITGRDIEKLKSVSSELQIKYKNNIVSYLLLDYINDSTYEPFLSALKDIYDQIYIVVNTAAGFYKGSFLDMEATQIDDLINSN